MKQQIKSNLHYTRDITLKRVTSGGAHLRSLAPLQHSSEETSQRWLAVGDTVSDLTGLGIKSQASLTDGDVVSDLADRPVLRQLTQITRYGRVGEPFLVVASYTKP